MSWKKNQINRKKHTIDFPEENTKTSHFLVRSKHCNCDLSSSKKEFLAQEQQQ